MMLAHIGFSLGLIALVVGVCLFLWSLRAEPGPGIALGKAVGIIVMVLAVLQLLCTVYSGIRYKDYKDKNCHCPMMKDRDMPMDTSVNQNVPPAQQPYSVPQNQDNSLNNNPNPNNTTPNNP